MFKPVIYASILVLSGSVAISACAPELTVGSQTSGAEGGSAGNGASGGSGGKGGDGAGQTDVSSSSGPTLTSSSSSSNGASSSSSSGSPGSNGMPCGFNDLCESGFCVDGVCCDQACTAPCQDCAQAGSAGTCLPLPIGTDECAANGELCNAAAVCACGVAKAPIGNNCPAGWVPGASKGSCKKICDTPLACANEKIECPAGFECIVECSGPNSCTGIDAEVVCPSDHWCFADCSGFASCQDGFRFRCSDTGPCKLGCGSDMSPCLGAEVKCGDNLCVASCSGATKPTMDTGNSCSAQGC